MYIGVITELVEKADHLPFGSVPYVEPDEPNSVLCVRLMHPLQYL